MSKYGAKKTTVDNIKFDSQAEARYYNQLKLLKAGKQITEFTLQPEFVIFDPFRDNTGKHHRAIKYRADFYIQYPNGTEEIVDVKGVRTEGYMMKRKMFMQRYPKYRFSEVKA